MPYLEPLVRGLSPRPACHNARLHALPADRLQRREESFGVSVVAPAAVALLFEELPHLAAERGLHRVIRPLYHAEDEPASFGVQHTPGFDDRMVYLYMMQRARREDRRHTSVLDGPVTVSVGHQELSMELRLLHLLAE